MIGRDNDQIDLIKEELLDLAAQVEAGDIDQATADGLRARYVAEIDRLTLDRPYRARELAVPPGSQARLSPLKGGRVSGRALLGTAIVAVAMAVIGVFAVNSLTGPSTAGVEGVVGDIVTGEGAVDLSSISNEEMEAVVAENPGVVGMRLALARRYFESGDFDKALDHYMVILENDKHPEALANVGWMTYISGRPDVALGYVEAALQRQPDSITATWFLGNIQFTLGNFDEAAVALGTIVDASGVPDDVKQSARSLLARMEAE
jgi:tetratricopeptide (TPR) repeat protein